MGYNCEICQRSYKYRKNLLRHLKEKHVINYEFWNCVVKNCQTKFIRRDYLYNHLKNVHKFPADDAKKAALKASRGDDVPQGYYEEISDDDTVLDLLDDVDVNSVNEFDIDEFIDGFQHIQNRRDDEDNNNVHNSDQDGVIIISSDEEDENKERAIEVSEVRTVTQIVTITRTVKILHGEIVSSSAEMESSYYEH